MAKPMECYRDQPNEILLGHTHRKCLRHKCTNVMYKLIIVFVILCIQYGFCHGELVPHNTAKAPENEKHSKATSTPPPSTVAERFNLLSQHNVDRAKSMLGITVNQENESGLKAAYKAEDTKNILNSIKNEFLTKHIAAESHRIKETPKQCHKESALDTLNKLSTQIQRNLNRINSSGPKEVELLKPNLENKELKVSSKLNDIRPVVNEKMLKCREKFINVIRKGIIEDQVSQEVKFGVKYPLVKVTDGASKDLMEEKKHKEVIHETAVENKMPDFLQRVSKGELAGKAENKEQLKPEVSYKNEVFFISGKSSLSNQDENCEKDSKVDKKSGGVEHNKLMKDVHKNTEKLTQTDKKENNDTQDKLVKETANGIRPAATKLEVEQEVLNAIDGRREPLINVTIDPARVINDKQQFFSRDGKLSHFLDAKEFFTSIPVKNFTLIEKERKGSFSDYDEKIDQDHHDLEDRDPKNDNASSYTEKYIEVVEDAVKDEVKEEDGEGQGEWKEEKEEVVKLAVVEDIQEEVAKVSEEGYMKDPDKLDDIKEDEVKPLPEDKEKIIKAADNIVVESETKEIEIKESSQSPEVKDEGEKVKDIPKSDEVQENKSEFIKEVDKLQDEKVNITETVVEETDKQKEEFIETEKVDDELEEITVEQPVVEPPEEIIEVSPESEETIEVSPESEEKIEVSPKSEEKIEVSLEPEEKIEDSAEPGETKDVDPSDPEKSEDPEKVKKNISESGKGKKKKEGGVEKPPKTTEEIAEQKEDENSPDILETYSQFTQRVNAEKKNDVITNGHGGNGHSKGPKVKSKNYASPDCGSKLMTTNPEATHSSKVIQSNKDEYMLNKCRDKTWFIIELCESIRPQKFDIANFELFSNLPKDIQVLGSHRYPTRDWANLSRVMGQEGNRGVQSFPIDTDDFFKYIKVEVLSHYGSEFFCPISLFRIYGLSEFEVIDTIEDSTDNDDNDETFSEPFEEEEARKKSKDEGKPSVIPAVLKNMFTGVLDVIKRGYRPSSSSSEPDDNCYSLHPKYALDNIRCSMAQSLNYILSCYRTEYEVLMQKPFVSSTVKNSSFCRQLASTMCLEPEINDSIVYDTVCNNSYVCVMLSPKHILAMCFMHDNRIMDTEVACDSTGSRLSENFSAASSDIISPGDEVPSYVKNAKINTSRVTRADALDTNNSEIFEARGIKLGQETESGQVLLEKELKKANESTSTTASEKSAHETLKSPKKAKANGTRHQDKAVKEADEKNNITEMEEDVEVEGSGFGGIELEEEEFSHGEELTTPSPPPVAHPHVELKVLSKSTTNKESVVVRLSNKIKALEYNMSISSQYLEELSRRYKHQMEEMQKQFNLTIAALNATSWQAYQRDQQHQTDIETLEGQLAKVSEILQKLVEERENLAHTVVEQHLLLMVVEVVVLCIVFTLCTRRSNHYSLDNSVMQERRAQTPSEDPSDSRAHYNSGCLNEQAGSRVRRRSVDSITRERASRQRQRRPSEEALNISGTYQDLLIIEPAIPILMDSVGDRKRKKKSSNGTLKRSKSNASIVEKSSTSRRSLRLEKLNLSSAGVLFCGDDTVTKGTTPPASSPVSSPDSPDLSGIPYEPFVNEQDHRYFDSGGDYSSCVTSSFVTEMSLDRHLVKNVDNVPSKRHSIASCQNCDNVHKKGIKLTKSSSVCGAPEKLKSNGEKVKKPKKVKKVKNSVIENLHNGVPQSHIPVALYDHDYYYPETNGTSYNCQDEQSGKYYYGGHTSVHFSDDTNSHSNHEFSYTGDTPCINGDSSHITGDYVGNDFMHTNHDKNLIEKRKVSPKTKTKVRLRSDNWEWYSAQHFGSSSSETISTCSDSSGKNRKTKTEEELGIVEKTDEKKLKKRKKSKSKSPSVLEEEPIPEVDAGT
ncbi:uncharacterized protein LOC121866057 isoform X3 [Homarus americanus]|uniref:uncharacterized protein LOC121866057 isoform X3 n=1 Tax=Homarus americanus TaxID=6706 RepID=UPI001C4940B3|nr:uncharacterized protein LOC121866057 isoform X3 [Homarus americanus]